MMDDIQEQTELADEISRAISEPAGFGMDVDEVSRTFYAGSPLMRQNIHWATNLFIIIIIPYMCFCGTWSLFPKVSTTKAFSRDWWLVHQAGRDDTVVRALTSTSVAGVQKPELVRVDER